MTRSTLLVLLLTAGGCSDPNTGIQTGGEMGGPDDPDCVEVRTVVSLTETTPLGFSAEALAALVAEPLIAEARYRAVSSEGLVRTPDSSTTTMQLDFQLDESQVVFVDASPKVARGLGPVCNDYLALGGTLTLKSDDGAFNEVLTTELWTEQADRLLLNLELSPEDISGSFSLAPADAAATGQFSYLLKHVILDGAWLGSLRATYSQSDDSGGSTGSTARYPYVDWGSGPCEAGTLPIAVDDAAYSSLVSQATKVITSTPVALAFNDDTSTVAALSFPQSPLACRVFDSVPSLQTEGSILLTGPLAISTEDGRWAGNLQGHIAANGAASALTELRLYTDAPELGEAAFASYYGFAGLAFGDHELARLQFGVTYATTGAPQATGGYFDIWATNDESCADCAPESAEPLLSAVVGNQ